MPIYFITGNKNKFAEAKEIIPSLRQLAIDLPEIQEIDAKKIIQAKLEEALKHKSGEFIVEDTSLYLDCLNGLPGPLIKWFLQTIGSKGIFELAKKYNNFQAGAQTCIGYAKNKNSIRFFTGEIKGTIVKPELKSNFGWDPIFMPTGFNKTFAEMKIEEKNKISHRRIAFEKFKREVCN